MKIAEALRERFNRENFPPIYIALERGWDPSIEELWEIYKAGAGEYIEGLEEITDLKEMWHHMEENAAFCLAQAKEFLKQQMKIPETLIEAREWLEDENHAIDTGSGPPAHMGVQWVEELYEAGAIRVEVIAEAIHEPLPDEEYRATSNLLVTIPPDTSKLRKLIIAVAMTKPDVVREYAYSSDKYHRLLLSWD